MNSQHEDFFQQYFSPLTLEVDAQGNISAWQGNLEHYGIDATNLIGTPVSDHLPCLIALPEDQDFSLPYINLPNQRVADIHIQRYAGKSEDMGEKKGYRVVLIDTSATQANLQKTQQLANDVSLLNEELRKLSRKLQDKNRQLDIANRAKADFISGLSHEFRTPIASVLGHTRWLKNHCAQNSEAQEHLDTIRRSSEYLLALIENLLRQGSIDADKLMLNPTPIKPKQLLDSLVDMIKPLASEKSLRLQTSLDLDENLLLELDENYLRQALVNLLSNAIKFTDEGEVTLSANIQDGQLQIRIKDSGIGIDAQDLESITSSFTRGKNAEHRPGLGLGLSIVHGIARAMNGSLDISSRLGDGTEVTLSIPAVEVAPKVVDTTAAEVEGSVMLLDDNRDITSLYRLFFKEAGIDLHTYHEPDELLEDLPSIEPRLLITDYHLQDTDGLSFVKRLRARGHQHPTILLTATLDVDTELRRRAKEAGCDDCWSKPVNVEDLIAQVKNQLKP